MTQIKAMEVSAGRNRRLPGMETFHKRRAHFHRHAPTIVGGILRKIEVVIAIEVEQRPSQAVAPKSA